MAENINNSEGTLETKNYLYGGFQRISSYDPNMCTTAAQFSPFYGKVNAAQHSRNSSIRCKNNVYIKPSNEIAPNDKTPNNMDHTNSSVKIQDHSYLSYNNDILIEQQNPNGEEFVENQRAQNYSVPFTNKEQERAAISSADGYDFVEQAHEVERVIGNESITSDVVLHRSPNGRLYQDFYVTNEDGPAEEIVELVPIDSNVRNHLEGMNENGFAFEFSNECNMETLNGRLNNENQMHSVADDERRKRRLVAQIVEKQQQRILLESTMSPLLAAVNDITQRDAELLSYLNQHVDKEEKLVRNLPTNVSYINQHVVKGQKLVHNFRPNVRFFPASSDEDEDDTDYHKPVQSRARATLPTNYLYFGDVRPDTNEPSVYAKKLIRQRTKFGPFDGEICRMNDICINILRSQHPRYYPLLLVGNSSVLSVTNEETSNWMRFVRMAQSFSEQNLEMSEEDGDIYFKCMRDIKPKEEIRVGYHSTYAIKYDLPILEPTLKDYENKFKLKNPWICFECDKRFPSSQEMQKHLEVHDEEDSSRIISKRKTKRKRGVFQKLSELPRNSSRCLICFKVFMTNASLKKHFASHLASKKAKTRAPVKIVGRPQYNCQMCCKKFATDKALKLHQELHLNSINNEMKPYKCTQCDQHCATPTALAAHIRGHTNRHYSCVYCQQTYKYVMDFKKHVAQHSVNGVYTCIHCDKKYQQYHLVRKHVRIFHPAVKYPCNECDRLFLHMSFLRRHKATHAKKTSFQCPQCEQTYVTDEDLQHHIKTFHKTKKKQTKKPKGRNTSIEQKESQLSARSLKVKKSASLQNTPSSYSDDYQQFQFKCENCKVGFKRRGMLVNHMAKRHPERDIDSIEDLNQPIVKLQTLFTCPHCPKIYKNNAKRKGHILKNHPGLEVPPSFRTNSIMNDANVQTVGCIKTDVQKCQFCYKQYASRTRLLSHYRNAHQNEKVPMIPGDKKEQCLEVGIDIYKPPVTPENKLLKLSSAALELSSIEDRKYFDFLNERSNTDLNKDNYKIPASEFGETSSSNTDLNRLPELFDDSIVYV